MTQERKDVWPSHYIREDGVYPLVMAEWLDTMIAIVHKHAKDISPDFRREMLELKEVVLTGDLDEYMRVNHPDIYPRVNEGLPENQRNKPYKPV